MQNLIPNMWQMVFAHIHQKCPYKIQGQTNTLTPKVLENNLDQHFLRPGRSHDGNLAKACLSTKIYSVF